MDTTTPSIKYTQSVFEAQIDKATVSSTREITFVIASEATGRNHRNGFVYNWDNWQLDSFNANPIVGYQHNVWGDNMCSAPNPDDVIAKATAWKDTFRGSRVIMSKATFEPAEINPTAEKVFQKIIFGSLNSSSTGVIPSGPLTKEVLKDEAGNVKNAYINFPGQILAEWSVVNIPADPEALRRSMRSHTLGALSFVQRILPELSMNDMRGMKVQELLDLIERKQPGSSAQLEEQIVKNSGPDPDFNKYSERLKSIKKA